jgi:phosphotransferase system enzyme I (PtsP)
MNPIESAKSEDLRLDSRKLFRDLRSTLRAEGGSARARMQLVVDLIAGHFHAAVCSLYQADAEGRLLTLAATKGLRREAVGTTALRFGEGLVGTVAGSRHPLSLEDAQADKRFAFRPETGEEAYKSFLGAPLIRAERLLGVLVLQHQERRAYGPEEVEHFETVAQFLSELMHQLPNQASGSAASLHSGTIQISARALSPGLAMGKAFFHLKDITIRRWRAEDPAEELARLEAALQDLEETLQSLLISPKAAEDAETRELLEADLMLVRDKGWCNRIADAIGRGLSAEAAVQTIREETRARMETVANDYIRERLLDLDDLSHRLLANLTGHEHANPISAIPPGSILVSRALGTAELLQLRRRRIAGLLVTDATPAAHLAIVARALKIPALGQAPEALSKIAHGDTVILDALNGCLIARPSAALLAESKDHIAARHLRENQEHSGRYRPCVSRDGVAMTVMANAGLLLDLEEIEKLQTDGIGLYRSEMAFLGEHRFPSREDQARTYRRVFEAMGDRPVFFRTLDIGADKQLSYFRASHRENNPALGWRAIRIGLDRPDIMTDQARALFSAAEGRALRVMFPMVSSVAEFDAARALFLEARTAHVRDGGKAPATLGIGVTVEVPALLWDLDRLFERADFASLGSNDLFQFLFAADRDNPKTSGRFDVFSPPALRLMTELSRAAARHGKPISVCGEICGTPLGVLALTGCGYRHFSVASMQIPDVRAALRSLDVAVVEDRIQELAKLPAASLQDDLQELTRSFGIDSL